MNKSKIAGLVVLTVVALVALFYGIKSIISVSKNPASLIPKSEKTGTSTSQSSSGVSQDPAIGKIAYASTDGVIVTNSDFSIYKIAAKDEWVGTVYSVGENNYGVSGDRYVLQGEVYLV